MLVEEALDTLTLFALYRLLQVCILDRPNETIESGNSMATRVSDATAFRTYGGIILKKESHIPLGILSEMSEGKYKSIAHCPRSF